MQEFLNNVIPNVVNKFPDFLDAIRDTLIMVGWAGSIAFVLGMFLGIVITVAKPGGILEHKTLYQVLDKVINFFRSIPFIILLTWVIPLSRAIMGTAIHVEGAIVPDYWNGALLFETGGERPCRNGLWTDRSGPVDGIKSIRNYFPGISPRKHLGHCQRHNDYSNQSRWPDGNGGRSGSGRPRRLCHPLWT